MPIVVNYPEGRLGNLLFQLVAAGEVASGGVVLSLASEATDFFEWNGRILVLPCPERFRKHAGRIWRRLFRFLASTGIVGRIEPEQRTVIDGFQSECAELSVTRGLFSFVFVTIGFFQHDRFKKLVPKLKPELLMVAKERLHAVSPNSRVAVHFRFGDYQTWAVYGVEGAVLPAQYYVNAFREIEARVNEPVYIVFSDDIEKAKAIMDAAGKKYFIYQTGAAISDFAGIASCSNAILSASSFAWWAATLISAENKVIVAPEFWLGFKSKHWFPVDIKTNDFIYLPAS